MHRNLISSIARHRQQHLPRLTALKQGGYVDKSYVLKGLYTEVEFKSSCGTGRRHLAAGMAREVSREAAMDQMLLPG